MMQRKNGLVGALLLLLCFYGVCGVASQSCLGPKAGETDLFFTSPVKPVPSLTACSAFNELACCSVNYTNQVAGGTDALHQHVYANLGSPSAACQDLFGELACIYCHPNQGLYFRRKPVSSLPDELHLCSSFCDRLYQACGSATLKDRDGIAVNQAYRSGTEFCRDDPHWFQLWDPDVITEGDNCFDPSSRPCTAEDYVGEYTECIDNHRNFVYHKKQPATGEEECHGGIPLPAPVIGLNCDITCVPGEYLPGGSKTCKPCPVGTFSAGGALRIHEWGSDEEGDAWPSFKEATIVSYCEDSKTKEQKCRPWAKKGSYITSGDNRVHNGIESILEMDITLVENGVVRFVAKVDAETGFDGLRFEVDDHTKEVVFQKEWTEYSHALTSGRHSLKWIYFKDYLWANGEDMAFIRSIEVTGIKYAADECIPCEAGFFTDTTKTSQCRHCPSNHVPAEFPDHCVKCDDSSYALPGDSTCRPRPPCTEADYEPTFTACKGPGAPHRDLIYKYLQPQICDSKSFTLPENQQGVPCEPCMPGEYRAGNYKCEFCATGHTSNMNENQCSACPAGTEAPKAQLWDTWENDVLPTGWSTSCTDCETGGFRVHYETLDSGDGEGLFDSWLVIEQEFMHEGSVLINASLQCPIADCSLTLWLDEILHYMTFSDGQAAPLIWNISKIAPGPHTIYLDFARWVPFIDESHDHQNTRVVVESIHFYGTAEGGAPECKPCGHNAVSQEASLSCTNCAPGTVANSQHSKCDACPVDTFSDVFTDGKCMKCGVGTGTNNKTRQRVCNNNNCNYHDKKYDLKWNLAPLRNSSAAASKVIDPKTGHTYYLTLCDVLPTLGSLCPIADGNTALYGCQKDIKNRYVNLGRVLNFIYEPMMADTMEKLVLSYTDGDVCRLDVNSDEDEDRTFPNRPPVTRDTVKTALLQTVRGVAVDDKDMTPIVRSQDNQRATITIPRVTNITIICDPTAGLGSPQAPISGIEQEEDRCKYEFVWYSLYGCHVCTEKDYYYYYTNCENGKHTKFYDWNYNPKRCVGDLALPPPREEDCELVELLCKDGEYVDPSTGTCQTCPAGTFSFAGGDRTDWWAPDTLGNFVSYCTSFDSEVPLDECDGGWTPSGTSIKTTDHLTGTAVLKTDRNFKRQGSVEFDFTLITEYGESFQFFIDDKLKETWNKTTMLGDTYYKTTVTKGTHTFKWTFSPFISDYKVRQAMIHSIAFNGTKFTESRCQNCPSPLVASDEGRHKCHRCPMNTYYDSNLKGCVSCVGVDVFSLPGDPMCHPSPACSKDVHYYSVFTECKNGLRNKTWLATEPRFCSVLKGDALPKPAKDLPCGYCPQGYFRAGDKCEHCGVGQYFDTDNGRCQAVPQGATSTGALTMFSEEQDAQRYVASSWAELAQKYPAENWQTGCNGECGSEGWRLLGTFMDSGVHYDQVDTWVSFDAEFRQDGVISFDAEFPQGLAQTPQFALEFFIDGVAQKLKTPPPSESFDRRQILTDNLFFFKIHNHFPVSTGSHTFTWLHHQDQPSVHGDLRHRISGISAIGVNNEARVLVQCPEGYYSSGGEDSCKPCPLGTFSSKPSSPSCQKCPYGSIAWEEGSTVCHPCGFGTVPNKQEGATACVTSCRFQDNSTISHPNSTAGYIYDLSEFSTGPLKLVSQELHKTFTFQFCRKMNSTLQSNPCGDDTYVCEDDAHLHRSFSAGRFLHFSSHKKEDAGGTAGGFFLIFDRGDSGPASECPHQRKSVFDFQCRLGAKPYGSITASTHVNETCTFTFTVISELACPVCEDWMIEAIHGECTDRKRHVTYQKKMACTGDIPESKEEECDDIEVNQWLVLWIIVGVLVVCAMLIGVAVYLGRKKSQLQGQYDLLVKETKGPSGQFEMEQFTNGENVFEEEEEEDYEEQAAASRSRRS
ncbi:hypothetical protein QOT17_016632 [Balamuthia mandrillaris]